MSAFHSTFRSLLLGLLPVLALVSSTSNSQASCGDYVHILTPQSKTTNADNHQPKVPCPCHGPSCQQTPAMPVPAPVAPVSSGSTVGEAMIERIVEASNRNIPALPPLENQFADPFAGLSVFHPPRI